MKVDQIFWTPAEGWNSDRTDPEAQLVLAFGGVHAIQHDQRFEELAHRFPNAQIISGSTAGEIAGNKVLDDSIVATSIRYSHTTLRMASVDIREVQNSFEAGKKIAEQLDGPDLTHVLVLSDGILVNGDDLVRGLNLQLPERVLVTGGLAADAGRFSETYIGLNATPRSGLIVAIGHYGNRLRVSHGSKGGWDEFGPVRAITRSRGNVLFELDGGSALNMYKKYLGDRAAELPGSALLFPLSVFSEDGNTRLVRTILNIDEKDGSMTFAGDVPQGSRVQFMMANFDRLIDGASNAAEESNLRLHGTKPALVLMISCVGRKLVLDQRVEEEIESVTDVFGSAAIYAGFYSNGEISPYSQSVACSLHNQTMTITTYSED